MGCVPILVLLLSWISFRWVGTQALILPPILMGLFLAYLLIELRHYQLGLFVRQTTEIRAMYSQVEALIGITRTLDPSLPLPPTRGWSASPDLLREIVDMILSEPPELVVEASSGTSTIVIGYCLRRLGRGRVVALEHDEKYAFKTTRALKAHGLEQYASVVYAPLINYPMEGKQVLWYDHAKALITDPIDLLIVDGPPDTIDKYARYPAVPLLFSKFRKGTRVLLDDGEREDERVIAERWCMEFGANTMEYLPLEKGAWTITFGQ
ncbi:MAG: class I SAM-dependent methyltransferase [Bacteroidota bacterium]|nr:class I SAM-dependent methyltransferase [Bacteroidota bacterium]